MLAVTRTPQLLRLSAYSRLAVTTRTYATQTSLGTTSTPSSGSRRRTVTPFNDNGRVPWGQLSAGEKIGRTTQQSFNFGLMILGALATGGVIYVMYTEVFAPDSKTNWYNRAAESIKEDPRCEELLGDPAKMTFYGEQTNNKWAVARPIASTVKKDQHGVEHMIMHFHAEGPLNKGVVSLHLEKRATEGSDYEYRYLKLDVKGHSTVYLEGGTANNVGKGVSKIFGVRWR